jgi:predicted RNA-binding Zn ribbon-like protein
MDYQQHLIEPLLGGPVTDLMCSAATLERIRTLRGAAAVVIEAARTGQCPAPTAVTDLDAALHYAPPATLSGTEAVCIALAQAVVNLASSAEVASIRECAAPGCTQLFLSAHSARRCTSWICDNRARAARHYQTPPPGRS